MNLTKCTFLNPAHFYSFSRFCFSKMTLHLEEVAEVKRVNQGFEPCHSFSAEIANKRNHQVFWAHTLQSFSNLQNWFSFILATLPKFCVLFQLSEAIGGGRKVLLEAVLSVGGNQDGGWWWWDQFANFYCSITKLLIPLSRASHQALKRKIGQYLPELHWLGDNNSLWLQSKVLFKTEEFETLLFI